MCKLMQLSLDHSEKTVTWIISSSTKLNHVAFSKGQEQAVNLQWLFW